MIVYAVREQADESLNEAEQIVRDSVSEDLEMMATERKLIRQIEIALCGNPQFIQSEADARLLMFIISFVDADVE